MPPINVLDSHNILYHDTINTSNSHFLCFLHCVPHSPCCLLIPAQHLIVALLHLEVDLRYLVLVVLTQLSAVHLKCSLFHNTCYFLLIVLKFFFTRKRLAGIAIGTCITVV